MGSRMVLAGGGVAVWGGRRCRGRLCDHALVSAVQVVREVGGVAHRRSAGYSSCVAETGPTVLQVQFLEVVDMPVVVQRQVRSAEVCRQGRGAEANPHGSVCSEDHRDFAVAVH